MDSGDNSGPADFDFAQAKEAGHYVRSRTGTSSSRPARGLPTVARSVRRLAHRRAFGAMVGNLRLHS
jgi:hypothetical protein